MTQLGSEHGAALILALLVVALLMVMVLEFDRSTRLEHRAAGNYRDETAAFYLAKAGLAMGQLLLQEDALSAPGFDALDEPWALTGAAVPIGRGVVAVSIIDEDRKFPVNQLLNPDWVAPFKRLLRALQIDENLADVILDWIDEDDNRTFSGAEDDYYRSLPIPYRAHNGLIESLDELLFVKGMTTESYQRLAPHLTTALVKKINLNTAAPLILSTLDEDMTLDTAERLVAERPYESIGSVPRDLRPGTFSSRASVVSEYFTVESEGIVNGISKVITLRIHQPTLIPKLLWVRSPA